MSSGHKTNIQRNNVSKIERKEKIQKSSLHPSYTHSPYHKISYTNPPPMSMTTLISKLFPFFCHEWQRASTSSKHLIITRQASTIILISILIAGAIVTLILGHRWRWRRSDSETTHDSLSSCDTTNTGVHLTHHWKCQGEHPCAQAMPWWPQVSLHLQKMKEQ